MKNQIADRQGDVTLIHTSLDPEAVLNRKNLSSQKPKGNRIVLAEGEVTGHAHTMPKSVVTLLREPNSETALLVVTETTVQYGSLIEGTVIATMPGGTIRFRLTDGTVMRFAPGDVEITKQGAKVKRAYTPLTHDEHDAIPVGRGVYQVNVHHTMENQRIRVTD